MKPEGADVTGSVRELLRHVDDDRQTRRAECVRLLLELTPRLQAAKVVERQLDRHLARRFNVFKYLREDELGLSRMIADLLDPTAEHGQGTTFLEAMLDALPETHGRFRGLRATATSSVEVMTERWTTTGGRIDITVDIPSGRGRFCLAFENKPYAHDQPGQLKAYLEYLAEQYGTRFLLVYLPPDDRGPDEISLPQADRERWQGHFTVMPYTAGVPSLEDWFATCRKLCDAEQLNWFLRHAQLFCRQRFGESTMTTDAETRFVSEYLSTNPGHLRAALAVHDAWGLVRTEICERFLEHLRHIVAGRLLKELPDIESDYRVRCRYGYTKRCFLWITRDSWVRYDDVPSNRDGRSAIQLQSGSRGPNGWFWGVTSPKPLSKMTGEETERREELSRHLGRHGLSLAHVEDDWWPQWEYLQRYGSWDPLVPELYEECEAGGGPITTYYADGLLKIAEHAIPAINEVEMVSRTDSGE